MAKQSDGSVIGPNTDFKSSNHHHPGLCLAVDASMAGRLDLSLLRDAPPSEPAAVETTAEGETPLPTPTEEEKDNEESSEQIADALQKCYLIESQPSEEELSGGLVQQDPSSSFLDADLYYEVMSGVTLSGMAS